MKIAVLYVGSSLPAALRRAEDHINREFQLGLSIALHNCTLPLADSEFARLDADLAGSQIVFIAHVTDPENAAHIRAALAQPAGERVVVAMNCMPELMRCTRLRQFDFSTLFAGGADKGPARQMARRLASWMWRQAAARRGAAKARPVEDYLKLLAKAPSVLRFLPGSGGLGDIRHYVTLCCYFLQPTPANIRGMILYAVQHYGRPPVGVRIRVDPPESQPSTGIFHPDAPALFSSFEAYRQWYENTKQPLDPEQTIGLLLMRPQVISGARRHYAQLIRAIEGEGLAVLPVLSTFMDNRQACERFLRSPDSSAPRVGQMVSLTGFSFVGGPAMNDSEAAVVYLKAFNRPLRSAVSLETQRTEAWDESAIGLNPVQTAMQVAIPEIDGASEPFVYAGTRSGEVEPEAFADRCARMARRLRRWNRLRRLPRSEVRLAFLIYCFPPNKGNLGTAADLDVFPSLMGILHRLREDGYVLDPPASAEELREALLCGDDLAHVAYRLPADEYFRQCPYVGDIEAEWGPAPGRINSSARDILIHGIVSGNVFVGVQPTFGYEGDPMKLLMARGGTPHHGFMGLYLYLDKIFGADAVVHVGTHGALEFMPGKQVGLSEKCWPDRLIGEFPNLYIYSVNNPSEGTIAKRRSYAELISYLTPPIESAGLYKEFSALKELLYAYRQSTDEARREQLFGAIEEISRQLHLTS